MSLLICTPVYGNPFMGYVESLLNFQYDMIREGYDFDILFLKNESLIQRARNNAVTTFLETKYERILFIDADIEFTTDDIVKLWFLDEDVCGAAYSMKIDGKKTTVWKNNEMVEIDGLEGPQEVDFLATGFLMVKRDVFLKMRSAYPELQHMEGLSEGQFEIRRYSMDWFHTGVSEGETPKDRIFWSEDYGFMHNWKKIGGKIILDPSIKLKHWGLKAYGAD